MTAEQLDLFNSETLESKLGKIELTEDEKAIVERVKREFPQSKSSSITAVVRKDYEVVSDLANYYTYRKLNSQEFLKDLKKQGKYIDYDIMCGVYEEKCKEINKKSLRDIEKDYMAKFGQKPYSERHGR